MSLALGLLGLIAILIGLVSIIVPLRLLRIPSRKMGVSVLGLGVVVLFVGRALSEPTPLSEQRPATPQAALAPAAMSASEPSPVVVPNHEDWTFEGSVISPVPGTWEHILWGGSPGYAIKVGGTYYLYYIGADGWDAEWSPTYRALGVATSQDGINFTKSAGNPIVTYSSGGGINEEEEGVTNPVVLCEDGVWHLWYGAGRAIGPTDIDIDIRYRTSEDGINWTDDTLVYQSPGDEYIPIDIFKIGETYHLYILGPLTRGAGALWVLSGTDPTSLSGLTRAARGPYRESSGLIRIGAEGLVMHLMGTTFGHVQAYEIDPAKPTTLGRRIRNYTFSGQAQHAILLEERGWSMYQLAISGEYDGEIVLRRAFWRRIDP